MIVACAQPTFNLGDEIMQSMDDLWLFLLSAAVFAVVIASSWMIYRHARQLSLAIASTLGLIGIVASALIMTFSSAEAEQHVRMHVSVQIPSALPYQPVPAPDPDTKPKLILIAEKK